jgi:hypothetical protein
VTSVHIRRPSNAAARCFRIVPPAAARVWAAASSRFSTPPPGMQRNEGLVAHEWAYLLKPLASFRILWASSAVLAVDGGSSS